MVEIKPQNLFPYLQEFQANFPVTDQTIFVFKETIYANATPPPDVIIHEVAHMGQQKKVKPKKWIRRYLTEPQFRLDNELEAYKKQIKWLKVNVKDRNEIFGIRDESARHLSSALYGGIISYNEAMEELNV